MCTGVCTGVLVIIGLSGLLITMGGPLLSMAMLLRGNVSRFSELASAIAAVFSAAAVF